MDTIDSLKRRTKTAEDLHSLVRTMKALAAVNIRQLENAVAALAEYRRTIELGLHVVLQPRCETNVLARIAPIESEGVVVFGSDQGMCGPMNDQLAEVVQHHAEKSKLPAEARTTLAIGTRVSARLVDNGLRLDAVLPMASSTSGITPLVQDIVMRVDDWDAQHKIDRVIVFFCEHTSRSGYQLRQFDLLPIDRRWLDQLRTANWPNHVLPTFTMQPDPLFSSLIHQYLFVSLYQACAESMASENASRLVAMQGAERNIGDRIGDLRTRFHQTRQMAITEELLDIVGGFEALGGDQ